MADRGAASAVAKIFAAVAAVSLVLSPSLHTANALPVFHTPNLYGVDGKECPLYSNVVPCPLLCVRDVTSDCPQSLKPSCPSGQSLCGDGTCQKSCDGILNACACGMADADLGTVFSPCMAAPRANITHFNTSIAATQTMEACSTLVGLTSTAPAWDAAQGKTDAVRSAWLSCPIPPDPTFTYREPMFISLYSIVFGEIALLAAWLFYKRAAESGIRAANAAALGGVATGPLAKATAAAAISAAAAAATANAGNEKASDPLKGHKNDGTSSSVNSGDSNQADEFLVRGFINNLIGTTLFYSVYVIAAGWLILIAIIIADYYGAVTGVQFGVFLTNDLNSKVFCVVWHFTVVWLVTVNVTRARLRNFFRIEVAKHAGSYVQIERPADVVIMMESSSRVVRAVRHIEDRVSKLVGSDVIVATAPVEQTQSGRLFFEYQATRYVYDDSAMRFQPFTFDLGTTHADFTRQVAGLSSVEAAYRYELVGPNFIQIKVPPFIVALAQEFTAFFYLYSLMCLAVWLVFSYYYMALVQICIILLSATIKCIVRLRSEKKIKALSELRGEVLVRRDGKWTRMCTSDLVPGDVIALEPGATVPCDAVVLRGEVVMNESNLTGEAMPVRKFAIKVEDTIYSKLGVSRTATLFDGTTVLQTSTSSSNGDSTGGSSRSSAELARDAIVAASDAQKANTELDEKTGRPLLSDDLDAAAGNAELTVVYVTATRTMTDKGKLVQRILYPTAYSFIFDEHLRMVVTILMIWGTVAFGLSIWLMGRGNITSWIYGIFVISELLSPLLPAALVVGQSVAAQRLHKKQIYCVDLPRIIMAGKVQVFCFDKTGTLTKEGLEFHGVTPVDTAPPTLSLPTFAQSSANIPLLPSLVQMGLATCHSVTRLGSRLVGNPIDTEMFRATGWELGSGVGSGSGEYLDTIIPPATQGSTTITASALHIVKRFEFVHARASMSVAVLDPSTKHVHVFVKGSFEKIRQFSNPESIPQDYSMVSEDLAREGCYVIGLAHRDLGVIDDLSTLQAMTREEMENGVTLLGLVSFKNLLKEDTADAIAELREGATRNVMITGDNALTGVYIGRACGMVPADSRILLADVGDEVDPVTGLRNIVWTDIDSRKVVSNVDSVLAAADMGNFAPSSASVSSSHSSQRQYTNVELAMTGRAFQTLDEMGLIRKYLLNTRIFARMTPDDKVRCVQLHMERAVTAMCGDGGNDCGALRAAHVGLAMSESEASIVSPFSTNHRSVQSCVELLRNGRTALATSFAGYKFLIMYGETMAWFELFSFYFSVIASQWIWIMIDGFVTVGLSWALTQAPAAKKLAPTRPTARLLGPQTLASTLGQVFINFWFFVGALFYLYQQEWFRCHEFDSSTADPAKWWLLGDSYEAELIGIVCLFQFIHAAAVFNFGSKFRGSWWRNYLLVILYTGMMAIVSIFTLADPNAFSCWFRVNCGSADVLVQLGYPRPTWTIQDYNTPLGHNVMPQSFRWKLWGYCVSMCALTILWEYLVVIGPVGKAISRWWYARRNGAVAVGVNDDATNQRRHAIKL
ncbi:hypothetical protein GQ42DRAFT_161851 [Ramicandelaber brevisporus]|nr:hypothetical protein GQ42DRAFT_161851 [Ramicandelaber brevisporus]